MDLPTAALTPVVAGLEASPLAEAIANHTNVQRAQERAKLRPA